MFALFAQSVIDSAQIEWLFANWKVVGAVLLGGFVAWRNRAKLGSLLSGVLATKPTIDTPLEEFDDDPRLRLSLALCQLTDHCQEIGSTEGVAACKVLAPLVMLLPDPPPEEEA